MCLQMARMRWPASFPKRISARMLSRERKRSERSRKHLVLMLIDGKGTKSKKTDAMLEQIAVVLGASIRETDLAGWFEANAVFGVIFTEFGECAVSTAVKIIESKITAELQRAFRPSQLNSFQISFYAFPDGWDGNGHGKPVDAELYPDLFEVEKRKKLSLLIKRGMDVLGSASALHFCHRCFWCCIADEAALQGPCLFPAATRRPVRRAVRVSEVSFDVRFDGRRDSQRIREKVYRR